MKEFLKWRRLVLHMFLNESDYMSFDQWIQVLLGEDSIMDSVHRWIWAEHFLARTSHLCAKGMWGERERERDENYDDLCRRKLRWEERERDS